MSPFTQALLFASLGIGTTLTVTSSHWLLAWMGLEMSTLAIVPLMARKHHPRAVEATTKYFLAQATAAAVLLFASISNAWLSGQWDISQMSHPVPTSLIMMALALKLGLAPFHEWLPEVLQGLDLPTGLLVSTWQKIAPFAILYQVSPPTPALLTALGLLSVLVGGWGGLNQTQVRKILAYSSIAHLGWMLLVLQFSPPLTLLTLMTYLIMTSAMFLAMMVLNSTTIGKLALSWTKSPLMALLVPLVLLSLAGLPPLTGFAPKWLILQELSTQGLPLIATLTAMSALLSLFFYLRVSYAVTLTISPAITTTLTPWRLNPPFFTPPVALFTMATISLLPLAPLPLTLTAQ
uniref:NADH dehydrogenase subunit 2 n=1 Tax=Enneapterygius hsiojenae TaxID=3000270 RepID=UPI0026E3F4B2|nr:NADH dehydrogenase subunit 2 [Enneapterygius hsiojenae]WJK72094.1 NADH dehydrogenase subunit 2 [Enneapterygius hsiojenae]